MLRKQNGVTMTLLVIMIIVLSILASITISTSTDLMKSSKVRNYISILSLVQVEVEKIYENFEFENDVDSVGGSQTDLLITDATYVDEVSDGTISAIIAKMDTSEANLISAENATISNVDYFWYKWTTSTLESLNIQYSGLLNSGAYLYVNYATGEILIPDGVKDSDGNTMYSLSGLKQ